MRRASVLAEILPSEFAEYWNANPARRGAARTKYTAQTGACTIYLGFTLAYTCARLHMATAEPRGMRQSGL